MQLRNGCNGIGLTTKIELKHWLAFLFVLARSGAEKLNSQFNGTPAPFECLVEHSNGAEDDAIKTSIKHSRLLKPRSSAELALDKTLAQFAQEFEV